ncbi:homologous-pairing protein 2 homolog isoform X2 [Dicentrarchus labrax]|uniref:homologous-pairing protein 2 homolog isoform X2 n=1 Tax=Dicentrarchus labrax TaxID=13489 RepID=UPI0021F57BBE|nr:homologous-pairing protein 2 homolog isoform X2 [Dicentrarchus labrax]
MSKKDNGASLILAYLNEKNRPYSAQDVFCNLQKQHGLGKTAQFSDINDADLKAMDCQISELSAEVQSLTQSCKQLDAELKELNSSLTTEEMISEIQELKAECSGYRERLEKIKSATNHVTPEEKEKVYKERTIYVKEWKKRKRLASDMINSILEGYPKSKKEFLDEVGVETDEDCKVVVPST